MSTPLPRRTWLVQRLTKPRFTDHPLGSVIEAFSFGGGRLNGGLSREAMDLLRPIFAFDYMGAAEFEFGAVPKALGSLAENPKTLVADAFTIRLADVAGGYRETTKPAPDAEATVYVLCRKRERDAVEACVRTLAAKDYTLKEATRLPSTLRPSSEYDGETVGWLELDNGFMFFTDRDMWSATCALFGLTAEVPA